MSSIITKNEKLKAKPKTTDSSMLIKLRRSQLARKVIYFDLCSYKLTNKTMMERFLSITEEQTGGICPL